MLNRNLKIFMEIAKYKSITLAAKNLYLTQPAVSNALSKLEADLNIKLFYRDKKNGLIITEVGEKILKLATQMEDITNKIYQTAYRENNLIEGRLRIASLTSLTTTIISKSLSKFREFHPNVTVEIKEGTPNEIFKLVEEHKVDFAVSASPFGNFDNFILINDYIVAISRDSTAISEPIDLCNPSETLIINNPAYETIMEKLPSKQFLDINKTIFVQNAETAIQMVNDAIGMGIISNYTLDTLTKKFYMHPIYPNISLDIGIFAKYLSDLTPVADEFISIIKEQHGFVAN